MIEVDGSFGEGGGQILRTSVSLAAVLAKDVRISNIRAGRSPPGLRAQHLTGVRAAGVICDGVLKGAEVGSTELVFEPSKLMAGSFRFDVGTAGSITLVLQTLLPVLAFAPGKVEVEITGGTDVRWSPPVDYVVHVVLPILRRMGFDVGLKVVRRGHYPRGGGIVRIVTSPVKGLRPNTGVDAKSPMSVSGVSHAVALPRHVTERQSASALGILRAGGLPEPRIENEHTEEGVGAGSGIVLYAHTHGGAILGADSLGERGKPAEKVGSEAAERLLEEVRSDAFLDRHMGDIIIPYMALADGVSEFSVSQITQHTLTNVKVAEWLAGVKFEVKGELGSKGALRAKGLGLMSSSLASPIGSAVSFRL